MDFGELKDDTSFIALVQNFDHSVDQIEQSLATAVSMYENYAELSTQEKVKLDNYVVYTINSLYWMHVKLHGGNPNEHDILNELSRVRQTMLREKQIHDHKTIRPVLNKDAAGRFIRHGLHMTRDGADADANSDDNETAQPQTDT